MKTQLFTVLLTGWDIIDQQNFDPKIMKIRENSANACTETLSEQENKANRVLKVPEKGSRGSQEVAWNAPRAQKIIDGMATLLILGCPGPP